MDDLTATMSIATVIFFLCVVIAYFCGWFAHTASKRYQTMKEELELAKELLDVLEDFVIDVEGYFGFSETDDMEPEDDIAYFIGEYCRAKRLIKKGKGTDQ